MTTPTSHSEAWQEFFATIEALFEATLRPTKNGRLVYRESDFYGCNISARTLDRQLGRDGARSSLQDDNLLGLNDWFTNHHPHLLHVYESAVRHLCELLERPNPLDRLVPDKSKSELEATPDGSEAISTSSELVAASLEDMGMILDSLDSEFEYGDSRKALQLADHLLSLLKMASTEDLSGCNLGHLALLHYLQRIFGAEKSSVGVLQLSSVEKSLKRYLRSELAEHLFEFVSIQFGNYLWLKGSMHFTLSQSKLARIPEQIDDDFLDRETNSNTMLAAIALDLCMRCSVNHIRYGAMEACSTDWRQRYWYNSLINKVEKSYVERIHSYSGGPMMDIIVHYPWLVRHVIEAAFITEICTASAQDDRKQYNEFIDGIRQGELLIPSEVRSRSGCAAIVTARIFEAFRFRKSEDVRLIVSRIPSDVRENRPHDDRVWIEFNAVARDKLYPWSKLPSAVLYHSI